MTLWSWISTKYSHVVYQIKRLFLADFINVKNSIIVAKLEEILNGDHNYPIGKANIHNHLTTSIKPVNEIYCSFDRGNSEFIL